jgi:hypothetical protein
MSYGGSEQEEGRETSNKGKKEIYISQRRNEDGFKEATDEAFCCRSESGYV